MACAVSTTRSMALQRLFHLLCHHRTLWHRALGVASMVVRAVLVAVSNGLECFTSVLEDFPRPRTLLVAAVIAAASLVAHADFHHHGLHFFTMRLTLAQAHILMRGQEAEECAAEAGMRAQLRQTQSSKEHHDAFHHDCEGRRRGIGPTQ